MATRKKATRKTTARRARPTQKGMPLTLDAALAALERKVPENLRPGVRQLRRKLKQLERQALRARTQGEKRARNFEIQLRRDVAKLLRRAETAVQPKR